MSLHASQANGGRWSLFIDLLKSGKSCNAGPGRAHGSPLRLRILQSVPPNARLTLRDLKLDPAGRRHVALIRFASSDHVWQALVAAALDGQGPRIIWEGATPTQAAGTGGYLRTAKLRGGVAQVTVGKVNTDIRICGLTRPTVLAPKVLASRDLSLHPALVQRIDPAHDFSHRDHLTAERLETKQPSKSSWTKLLQIVGASTAVGSPSNLTDGNPETVWSEGGYQDGRWEFVTFRTLQQLPLQSLTLRVRPPKAQIARGMAPKNFWITSEAGIAAVRMPDDAWKHPGAQYKITFPKPITTSCLSVVLDRGTAPTKSARVTLAEVSTESSGVVWASAREAVTHLDDSGATAELAEQLLLRGAPRSYRAVAAGYGTLHKKGRERAMRLLDASSCEVSSWVWAPRLASRWDIEKKHAIDRIRRCRRRATPALLGVIEKGPGCGGPWPNERLCRSAKLAPGQVVSRARMAAADELSTVAPERAVPVLAKLLASDKTHVRRDLRRFLARTASHEQAAQAWREVLDATSNERITLDLLRSVHGHMSPVVRTSASAALKRLTSAKLDIDERYLVCEPAAALAATGDLNAQSLLKTLMHDDPEPMVRMRAVSVTNSVPALRGDVAKNLRDRNVRVRLAAARSVHPTQQATKSLIDRLGHDDWPMVRAACATALQRAAGNRQVLDALGTALADRSPKVRLAAVESLGQHHASRFAPQVRDIADAAREKVSVRIAAVRALGQMCDRDSLHMLTLYAQRSSDPHSAEAGSGLGRAAVLALTALHPTDLKKRLAPLLEGRRTPRYMKDIAQDALSTPGTCHR